MGSGFEFVLVNDRNKNEKVKNHLRQRQSALRRAKLKEWSQASAALKTNSILANGPLAFRHRDFVEDTSESSGDDVRERPSLVFSQTTQALKSPRSRSAQITPTAVTRVVERPSDELQRSQNLTGKNYPRTILSMMRSDPFRTYPIHADREVDELFDLYTTDLGPRIFQYTSNPTHDIFHINAAMALLDPAAFHSIMIMAAISRDRLSGRSLPGLRALYHRVEAIRLINERLDCGDPEVYLTEGTIFAILRLEVLEKQWNAVGESEIHMPGLQALIVKKGGLRLLAVQLPRLEFMLYATAVVMPRMLHAGSPTLYCSDHTPFSEQQEECTLAQELVSFLERMAIEARYNSSLFTPLREFALGSGRPIFELLESPSAGFPVYRSDVPTPAFGVVAERLRMSILLYMHCTLLGRVTYGDMIDIVDHLHWLVQQELIWKKSLRTLHHLIVKDEESLRLADHHTAWYVLRLGSATCLLDHATRGMVQSFLWQILRGGQGAHLDMERVRHDLAKYT